MANIRGTKLAEILRSINPRVGAEIGVQSGGTSVTLLETFSELTLYLVDRWEGTYAGGQERTRRAVDSFGDRAIILLGDSVDMSKHIEDGSLDFVFIDAGHRYERVKGDIEAWAPKVRKGGLITGHDYTCPKWPGVKRAADEYFGDVEVYSDGGQTGVTMKGKMHRIDCGIWVYRN
jgi:predicted O-methyltransferase YrrM